MTYSQGVFYRNQCHGVRWLLIFSIALSFLAQGTANANNPFILNNVVTLRGFGTLGLARSTTDQAEFVRDLSQPGGIRDEWSSKIDSLIGIQTNFSLGISTEAVAQIVSRYHSDGSHQPELMWGFLTFNPNDALNLRIGRLGTEFYMLSDSRLVGYSYTTVRSSNDYFGSLPFYYVDGADALLTLPLGDGLIRGKLMTGWAREDVPSGDFQFKLNQSLLLGGYLDYQTGPWQWRFGYSQLRFHNEAPAPAPELFQALEAAAIATGISTAQTAAMNLSVMGKLEKFYSLGVVYDNGPLQTQLMLNQTCYETKFFENSRAGYFLGSYQLGSFRPFAGYSWFKSSPKSLKIGLPSIPPFTVLDAAAREIMNYSHGDQHTFTLGTRWDFLQNMALKFQWDGIHGKSESGFPYRFETKKWLGHMNIFSLTLDFVF